MIYPNLKQVPCLIAEMAQPPFLAVAESLFPSYQRPYPLIEALALDSAVSDKIAQLVRHSGKLHSFDALRSGTIQHSHTQQST